jgi:hypothetical protein
MKGVGSPVYIFGPFRLDTGKRVLFDGDGARFRH